MRLLAPFVLLLALSACGGGGPIAPDKVDQDAWRAELTKLDNIRSDPDMDALDKAFRDDCSADVDALAIRYSLEGARPDVARISLKYICPDEVHKIDEAVAQIQDANASVDEACALDSALRTEDQAALAEALACD